MLSRQPLRPCGECAWVKGVDEAVQWVRDRRYRLCTSVGMTTWELLVAVARDKQVDQTILVPSADIPRQKASVKRTREQFDLDDARVEFMPVMPLSHRISDNDLMVVRDRMAVGLAEILVPVSVRSDGLMSQLLEENTISGKPVESRFRVTHEDRETALSYKLDPNEVTDEIAAVNHNYLIHWTRATNCAWPTEKAIDYYRSLVTADCYPRGACDTLRNILASKVIKASGRHMPERIPTVSFTRLSPVETLPLMRWRARYREMSFEPYGIGIEKEYARDLGIQQVQYYEGRRPPDRHESHLWLTQSLGEKGDWGREGEYRYRGDLDLSKVPSEYLVCLTRSREEALSVRRDFGIRAVAFSE